MKSYAVSTYLFLLFALVSLQFTACDKDDDNGDGTEQELITTVTLTVKQGNATVTEASFRDPDGAGGNAPTIDDIVLAANSSYTLEVAFLDESKAGAPVDITEEVAEENEEHLVCFATTGGLPQPVITDQDDAGQPLGLRASLNTAAATNGSLTVRLKHEPNKSAPDPCVTGETDVEVTFDVVVN